MCLFDTEYFFKFGYILCEQSFNFFVSPYLNQKKPNIHSKY